MSNAMNNMRTEIETVNTSKYTTYTKVYKYNGQEFPALRDLIGKFVILRNGNRAFCVNCGNKLALFINGVRQPYIYGRRLTASRMSKKGTPLTCGIYARESKTMDIISVIDGDGLLFWERVEQVKEKPVLLSEVEAIKLLSKIYGKKINLNGTLNRDINELENIMTEKSAEEVKIEILKTETKKYADELKAMAV